MGFLRAEVAVAAPANEVWAYVTDWERQGEWVPLTRVEREDRADHVGGRLRAWTGFGPVGFWDTMVITAWEPPTAGAAGRCEVLHTGRVVRGDAGFTVTPAGAGRCTAAWWERVDLPGGPVGRLLWRLASPLAERLLTRVMAGMARRAEALHAAG